MNAIAHANLCAGVDVQRAGDERVLADGQQANAARPGYLDGSKD
jgi:hypothetical protein